MFILELMLLNKKDRSQSRVLPACQALLIHKILSAVSPDVSRPCSMRHIQRQLSVVYLFIGFQLNGGFRCVL